MRKFTILALAAVLALAACSRTEQPPAPAGTATTPPAETALGRKIQEAMDQASVKLARENIVVGGRNSKGIGFGDGSDTAKLPRAEITPQGDLLIAGKAVAVDEQQRQLLLAYRAQVISIAQAGMAIGMRGADLGVKAATGALKSVFSGTTGDFEKKMEAEGKRIEAEANRLCALLPGLLASQQALAASVPEFGPYATMDQSDVEECGKDGKFDVGGDTTTAAEDTATEATEATEATGAADTAGDHTRDAAAEADARGSATKQ